NNSLQRDLLFLLSERTDKAAASGVIPSVADLEPSKLFFVGDEKQSIYKFSGADVSVFRRLEDEMKKNGEALTLSTNYRSRRKLIDHFNRVFGTILASPDGDVPEFAARSNPITPGRQDDGTDAKIILSVFDQDRTDTDLYDKDFLEAEIVGSWCKRILGTDEFLVDGKRPEPSDIAILFRTAGNQMNIEKALKRRGIPYQLTETRSLMIDAVANDFYCFVNCLLYPDDMRSFIALLKSPFCGMSEESIRFVVNQDIASIPEIDKDRYHAFIAFFASMKEKAFRLPLSELLETLWIEGGYKAFIESEYDREVFAEHYEYLYSYAVDMDSRGKGLAEFARFLRTNTGKSDKLPETQVLARQKTGVQIMTVHKSKGLDFKVVIFAGTGTRLRNDGGSYVFRWRDGIVATENRKILKILENDAKEKEEAELRRILYVALTRAKDHLILTGSYKINKDGSPFCGPILKWYMEAVGFNAQLSCCDLEEVTVSDESGFVPETARTRRKKSAADVRDAYPVFVESSLTSAVTASHEEGLSFSEGEKLPVFDSDPITVSRGLRDKFGTLCHSALELFFKEGNTDSLSCGFCANEGENRILLARARAFAQGFSDSSFYKEHIEGHKTHPEMRFYTYDENNPDIAVEGVIDLLVEGNDYNLVVDYKTDALKNPEVHKHQLMTYVRVAKELTGKESRGVLYYLRDGSLGPVWDKDGKEITI
ncbi:MAG: PD-(D/E)XK nuclease family protein, partial [Spirochaetales bacterium]|nr:PD-(D/E)XK nuclease family protein [Spirochaetales bacterium]